MTLNNHTGFFRSTIIIKQTQNFLAWLQSTDDWLTHRNYTKDHQPSVVTDGEHLLMWAHGNSVICLVKTHMKSPNR